MCVNVGADKYLHTFFLTLRPPPIFTLFPYTTLFRSYVALWLQYAHRSSLHAGRFFTFWLVVARSEERFSRNAETELVCRLLLEKKNSSTQLRSEGSSALDVGRVSRTPIARSRPSIDAAAPEAL